MLRDFSAILVFVVTIPSLWSQSAADLAEKYPRHEVYEVEPGVVMSPKFAPNGLVCEMRVEQTHFKGNAVNVGTGIEREKINALVDRLVPPAERGEKEPDSPRTLITISGPTMAETDRYANVIVDVMSSVETRKKSITVTSGYVLIIKWRNRSCSWLA